MQHIPNRIADRASETRERFDKLNPADAAPLYSVARSGPAEVDAAVAAARQAQPAWAGTPAARRGDVLFAVAEALHARRE